MFSVFACHNYFLHVQIFIGNIFQMYDAYIYVTIFSCFGLLFCINCCVRGIIWNDVILCLRHRKYRKAAKNVFINLYLFIGGWKLYCIVCTSVFIHYTLIHDWFVWLNYCFSSTLAAMGHVFLLWKCALHLVKTFPSYNILPESFVLNSKPHGQRNFNFQHTTEKDILCLTSSFLV